MSFLFPLYLLGALAIALPVLMHLRKRPPRERVPFGSLMFLEKTPELLTRRTRIERWLLLALRCLALIALALVFGRPFLKSGTLPSELADASAAVILVDRSASMQRGDLFRQAFAAAREAVGKRPSRDEVALLFFDRNTELVAGFPEWADLGPAARISDLERKAGDAVAGWDITDPGAALVEAADLISARSAEREFRRKEIVLISDFAEGASYDTLNQFAWPEDIFVECVPLAPGARGNLSLTLAVATEEQRTSAKVEHRVRVENAADSPFERFVLRWDGQPEAAASGIVPPGSSRVLTVPAPVEPSTSLSVSGDSHPFDNTVYIAPPAPVELPILFLSADPEPEKVGSPYFYLARALHPTAALRPSASAATFDDWEDKAAGAAAIVVHGNWTQPVGEQLHRLAASGKLIVALPGAGIGEQTFAALFGGRPVSLEEASGEPYVMLANLDFEHPILAPFARARIRDFTKIRFWKHRRAGFPADPARAELSVLAEFDDGSPAWVVSRVGDGSIFAFLSGWEPSESQFALSSKFVPLLYSIFDHAGYSARRTPTYYVGEVDVLEEGNNRLADRPGLFRVEGPSGATTVSVNLHPLEGRVDPIDPDHRLAEFQIPLEQQNARKNRDREGERDPAAIRRLENEERESRQKLWKWLVLAVLLFLAAETWLSGRRRHAAAVPA